MFVLGNMNNPFELALESSAVAASSPTHFNFLILYLKKLGTPDENAFTDWERHGTFFQAPSGSDLIAKAQFLSFFVPDRLNTFLLFCDTIIC